MKISTSREQSTETWAALKAEITGLARWQSHHNKSINRFQKYVLAAMTFLTVNMCDQICTHCKYFFPKSLVKTCKLINYSLLISSLAKAICCKLEPLFTVNGFLHTVIIFWYQKKLTYFLSLQTLFAIMSAVNYWGGLYSILLWIAKDCRKKIQTWYYRWR